MESNQNIPSAGTPTPAPAPTQTPTPAPTPVTGGNKGMSDVVKIGLIFGVLIIIIAGAIYWYVSSSSSPTNPEADLSSVSENAIAEVLTTNTASSDIANYVSPADPTSAIVEVNPVEAANPFSDLQVNPFE